jgi:hypothetical protein
VAGFIEKQLLSLSSVGNRREFVVQYNDSRQFLRENASLCDTKQRWATKGAFESGELRLTEEGRHEELKYFINSQAAFSRGVVFYVLEVMS